MKPEPNDKAIVELGWIEFYDSIEPLKKPYRLMSKEEKRKMARVLYNEEYRNTPGRKKEMAERSRLYRKSKHGKKVMKKYRQKPEVKKKRREYERKRYQRNKEEIRRKAREIYHLRMTTQTTTPK